MWWSKCFPGGGRGGMPVGWIDGEVLMGKRKELDLGPGRSVRTREEQSHFIHLSPAKPLKS